MEVYRRRKRRKRGRGRSRVACRLYWGVACQTASFGDEGRGSFAARRGKKTRKYREKDDFTFIRRVSHHDTAASWSV